MTVYLCGAINGKTDADCKDWREKAKALLKCDTLDPMRRDYRGREVGHGSDFAQREMEIPAEIVNGDLFDIAASDVILVNASAPSWGTAMEVIWAHRALGKKVYTVFPFSERAPSPWLLLHSTGMFETLREACDWINDPRR